MNPDVKTMLTVLVHEFHGVELAEYEGGFEFEVLVYTSLDSYRAFTSGVSIEDAIRKAWDGMTL